MAHELDDYVNPAALKKLSTKRHMMSMNSDIYDRLTALSKRLKIDRTSVLEALLNYIDDKPQVGK